MNSTGIFRRQLNAELSDLGTLCEQHALQDGSSEMISTWQQQFRIALRSTNDLDRVYQVFRDCLIQDILQDPLVEGRPFDQEALLGSDGFTYGGHSLFVYQHEAPQPYRYRSPVFREETAPFSTSPHPIIRWAVNWFARREELSLSPVVEARFQELQELLASQAPRSAEERRRYRAEREAMRSHGRRQEEAACQERLSEQRQQQAEAVEEVVQPIFEQSRANAERQQEEIRQIHAEDQEGAARLQEETDRLDREIDELEVEIEELGERIENVDEGIDEAEMADLHLQQSIMVTKLAIKKARNQWKKTAMTAVAIAAACLAVTAALALAIEAAGLSVTLTATPMGSQGAMLSASFAI